MNYSHGLDFLFKRPKRKSYPVRDNEVLEKFRKYHEHDLRIRKELDHRNSVKYR